MGDVSVFVVSQCTMEGGYSSRMTWVWVRRCRRCARRVTTAGSGRFSSSCRRPSGSPGET